MRSKIFTEDRVGHNLVNETDKLFAEFEAQETALSDEERHKKAAVLEPELNIDYFGDHGTLMYAEMATLGSHPVGKTKGWNLRRKHRSSKFSQWARCEL